MGLQNKSTRLKEFYATIVANFPVVLAGMQAGFPAFIMPQLEKEFDLDVDRMSWIVFAGYFSLLFSPLIVTYLITKYGRKTNLRLTLILSIIGWCLILISSSFTTLLIGSIFCGIAAGSSLPLASTYVAEISRAKYRTPLLSMAVLMGIFGTAFVYMLELSLTWRQVVMVIIGIATFGIYQLQVVPESKIYYMLKKRREDALKSTAWFENKKVALKEAEIIYSLMSFGTNLLQEDDLDAGKLSFKALKRLQLKPFLLALSVSILRCGTGKVLFTVYPVNMFTNLGTPFNGKILAVGFGVLNFFCLLLNMFMYSAIDRMNRKNIFYIFSTIMITSLTIIIFLQTLSDDVVKPYPALLTVCMYVYLVAESTGFNSILSIMIFEVIPMTQRSVASTIQFYLSNLLVAVYVKVFPLVEHSITFRILCSYLLLNMVLILVIVHFFYPDTRGNMFAGYEKQFLKSIKNVEVEQLMSNDWLRNEALQEFLTGNEHVNIEFLNNDAVQNISKEWAERMRDIVKQQENSVENFMNAQEQQLRMVDGTQEAIPLLTTPIEINPQEILNTMKNTFSVFMENNPMMNAEVMWNPNNNMFMQQQEWIKNTWMNAKGGSQPKKS